MKRFNSVCWHLIINFLPLLGWDFVHWCASIVNHFIHEPHSVWDTPHWDGASDLLALTRPRVSWRAPRSPRATPLPRSETYCCLSPCLYRVHISAAALINAKECHSLSFFQLLRGTSELWSVCSPCIHSTPSDSLMELIICFVAVAVNGELVEGSRGWDGWVGGLFVASSSFTDHI